MLLLSLLLLFLMAGTSGAETSKSVNMSVTEGDAITLQSDLSEILNDDTILWMFGHNDALISQIQRTGGLTSFLVTDDVGFRGRLQVDQNTGSLTIRNTRKRHSGQYKLFISREKNTVKIFHVTVFVVVGKMDGVNSVSLSVIKGDPVTLHTDSKIHRDALMLWRFGDKGILLAKIDVESNETLLNNADVGFRDRLQVDQTGSLTIKNTRTTDSGFYELQIKGSESLQRFLVTVSDAVISSGAIAGIVVSVIVSFLLIPIVFVIYFHRRINKFKRKIVEEKKEAVTEGESLTLHAGLTETQGDATIKWCYETDDNLIAEMERGTRRTHDGADGRFRSKLNLRENGDLTISNVRTLHSGLYTLSRGRKNNYKKYIVTINVKKQSVTEGGSVHLQNKATIQSNDLILWTLGPENILVVKKDSGTTIVSERFKGRLSLGKTTASLTITNITDTDSGLFKLQIINDKKTTFRRITVTVTGSTGNQVSDLETAVMLLSDDVDEGNEQEETLPL